MKTKLSLIILAMARAVTFGQGFFPAFASENGFTSYKQVVLSSSPSYFWLYDNSSGNVPPYSGSVSLTTPSDAILGVAGLLNNDNHTAAYINSASGAGFASLSTLGNFDYTNSFGYGFLMMSSNTLSSNHQYALASGYKLSAPYNGIYFGMTYQYPSETAVPSTWQGLEAYFGGSSGNGYDAFGFCNVANSTTNMINYTYSWVTNFANPNGTPYVNFYLNGNSLEAALPSPASTLTSIDSGINITMLANSDASDPFLGTIQSTCVYTNLTEIQILTQWLAAFQSTTYQPNSYIYSALKGTDTAGNPLRISAPAVLQFASSNLVFGLGTTGTNILAAGFADQTNVNQVPVYSCTNFCQGSYVSRGIAFDGSFLTNYNASIVRPSILYNTNGASPYYAMWLKETTNYYSSGVNCSLVATSTVSQFPTFYTNSINYLPNGNNAGDETTFIDTNGSAYLFYALYPGVYETALNSTFTASSGSATEITTTDVEGLGVARFGTNYFMVGSPVEYYSGLGCTDVWYWVSTTGVNGPWIYKGTIYASGANPYGSGLEGQSGGAFFQDLNFPDLNLMIVDHWHNGDLSASTTIFEQVNVVNGTNLVVYPSKLIKLQ